MRYIRKRNQYRLRTNKNPRVSLFFSLVLAPCLFLLTLTRLLSQDFQLQNGCNSLIILEVYSFDRFARAHLC